MSREVHVRFCERREVRSLPATHLVTWDPAASPSLQKITPLATDTGLFTISCPTISCCLAFDDRGRVFGSTEPTGPAAGWSRSKLNSQGGVLYRDCPSTSRCVVVDNAGHVFAGTRVTTRTIRAQLLGQLAPSRAMTTIGSLLRHDGATLTFAAPIAGELALSWYSTTRRRGRRTSRKPTAVLIATGDRKFRPPDTATIKLVLTRAGRQILNHANRIDVTARSEYTPAGGAPVALTRTFVLHR